MFKKNKILFVCSIVASLMAAGCDDLFAPAIENNRGLDAMSEDVKYAQGILANGYTRIPNSSWSFNDVATDDAVTNNYDNSYLKMATGAWTSISNPMEKWRNCRAGIQYMNIFLSRVDEVKWADNELVSELFNDRMKGEAYGLRALFMYYLLQAHAGYDENGNLLGVPIVLEPDGAESDFNVPRDSFDDCMQQLYSDVEKAIELLPMDYTEIYRASQVPEKYQEIGVGADLYGRVFGDGARLRMTARIAMAIRVQAALMAASPAYASGSSTSWEDVANYAALLIDDIGGVSGLDPNGLTWYTNASEIEVLESGASPAEIIWRSGLSTSYSLESDNFPPTLYGNGRVNPTQNLVDAFPMKNGYPITSSSSGYDASNPYSDRDPRLCLYILCNGQTAGVNGSIITTAVDGTSNDALGKVETSTRTGYYLKKLLRQDVSITSSTTNGQKHYKPYIRYTEMFLAYAEAANEAWGPKGKGTHGYSAYDVIKAIRERAGVGLDNGDAYLESAASSQASMRELIRNERRLELCFEGFRFWDLRRWQSPLNESAKGVKISGDTYSYFDVENRVYSDYMYYGPVPYDETVKFSALQQNAGW